MPNCVFKNCKNNVSKTIKSEGISFHTFPSDDLLDHKWINIVQAERRDQDWMPNTSSTICSNHFKEEDKYMSSKGSTRLKKNAIPVIATDNYFAPQSTSSTSLGQLFSNNDSEFNSAITAKFEMRVRKLVEEKKILEDKNKDLQNENDKLRTQVTIMKNMLRLKNFRKGFSTERDQAKPREQNLFKDINI